MRLLITLLLIAPALLLACCDNVSKPAGQGQEVGTAPSPSAASELKHDDISLESENGLKAELTYDFAGKPAPAVSFTGADGRDVEFSDFAGRPLLVNIWATWCAPCKAEMPTLDALAVLEEGKTSVIAVSQDLEGRVPVADYFAKAGFENLEPYIDPQNLLLSQLGGNIQLPTTILYNSQGIEVWRVVGGVEWDDAEMAELLKEAA
jgi:thiol-disulfide isomerase/thioredoxin